MTSEEYDDEEPVDFLHSMMACGAEESQNDDDQRDQNNKNEAASDETRYNPRKPLWWKKLSGKPSKGQKRAMTATAAWRLPKVAWGEFLDWNTVFPVVTPQLIPEEEDAPNKTIGNSQVCGREIWLEIGFGTGDNLLALAEKYPERRFVGAEVHNPGLGKLCQRLLQALQNNQYWSDYEIFSDDKANRSDTTMDDEDNDNKSVPPTPLRPEGYTPYSINNNNNNNNNGTSISNSDSLYSNLRLYGGDGVKLLPYIPSHSMAAVLVTFPDPFPKDAQMAFRVLQKHTLLEIHRVLLRQGGRLFLATDHEGHHEWCHATIGQVNRDYKDSNNSSSNDTHPLFGEVEVTDRTEWLPVISKYEQKGWNEGRHTNLSCWKAIHHDTK